MSKWYIINVPSLVFVVGKVLQIHVLGICSGVVVFPFFDVCLSSYKFWEELSHHLVLPTLLRSHGYVLLSLMGHHLLSDYHTDNNMRGVQEVIQSLRIKRIEEIVQLIWLMRNFCRIWLVVGLFETFLKMSAMLLWLGLAFAFMLWWLPVSYWYHRCGYWYFKLDWSTAKLIWTARGSS